MSIQIDENQKYLYVVELSTDTGPVLRAFATAFSARGYRTKLSHKGHTATVMRLAVNMEALEVIANTRGAALEQLALEGEVD